MQENGQLLKMDAQHVKMAVGGRLCGIFCITLEHFSANTPQTYRK